MFIVRIGNYLEVWLPGTLARDYVASMMDCLIKLVDVEKPVYTVSLSEGPELQKTEEVSRMLGCIAHSMFLI